MMFSLNRRNSLNNNIENRIQKVISMVVHFFCFSFYYYYFFLKEFQPMTFAPENSLLSSDQDTNWFLV